MIRSNLCDYSDAYVHIKATIAAAAAPVNNTNKKLIFKNCAPFTNCISKKNNTQVDDAQDSDIVIPIHNLIEYGDIYLKTSTSLWQYYRDEPALEPASC